MKRKLSVQGKEIKLVSFDLWETVISETREKERNRQRAACLAAKLGLPIHETENAVKESGKVFLEIYEKQHRTMLTEERLAVILSTLGRRLPVPDFREVARFFSEITLVILPSLIDGIKETLEFLKKRDMIITMISDTGFTKGADMRQLLERYGIFSYFDLFVFSDEMMAAKPHPVVFKKVEATFPWIAPFEMVHIGDNPRTDMEGAKKAGWNSLFFQREGYEKPFYYAGQHEDNIFHSWPQVIHFLEEQSEIL